MKKWILPIAVCALILGFSGSAQAQLPPTVVGVSSYGGFYHPGTLGVNYTTRFGSNGVLSVGYATPVYNYGYTYGVTQFGIPGYTYRSYYATPYVAPVVPVYGVPVVPAYRYYGGFIIR